MWICFPDAKKLRKKRDVTIIFSVFQLPIPTSLHTSSQKMMYLTQNLLMVRKS